MLKNVKRELVVRSSLVLALVAVLAASAGAAELKQATEETSSKGALGLAQPVTLDAPEEAAAEAEESTASGLEMPTFSADVTFANKYVWRGIRLTDGPVMQPSVTVGWYGFSFNIWGNMDLDDANANNGQFNEIDYTLDYTTTLFEPLEWLEGSVGFIVYQFPNTAFPTTTEFYLGLAAPDVLLSPSLTAYFDIDEINGVYLQGAIGHSFDLGELCEGVSAAIDLGATLGVGSDNYCQGYFGVDKSSFTDYSFSLAMPIAIGDNVSVTPSVTLTGVITGPLRSAVAESENIVYGVNVGVSF
jgi:hypothetical protein